MRTINPSYRNTELRSTEEEFMYVYGGLPWAGFRASCSGFTSVIDKHACNLGPSTPHGLIRLSHSLLSSCRPDFPTLLTEMLPKVSPGSRMQEEDDGVVFQAQIFFPSAEPRSSDKTTSVLGTCNRSREGLLLENAKSRIVLKRNKAPEVNTTSSAA